ncbi:MAG TPA: hypothetical protein VKU38_23115 [Ktedonobacteraceae bacterium]|nr:hypothetical protein [Ktedonobacteraceae bacterium]
MGQHEEQGPDSQIRTALKDVLATSEKQVPPTTGAILAAIRQEQSLQKEDTNSVEEQELEPGSLVPSVDSRPQTARRSPRRTRVIWQNIAAIAAVLVIILASVGLFSHRFFAPAVGTASTPTLHKTPLQTPRLSPSPAVTPSSSPATSPTGVSSSTPSPAATVAPFDGWNRVALVTPMFTLANLNYLTDCCTPLTSNRLPSNTIFDGVSQDGQNVMYHTVNDGTTVYYTQLSASKNATIYTLKGNGGNAIWLNSTYALITTFSSVIEVNVQAETVSTFLPSLMAPHINFYRKPFLYFTGGADRTMDALYRIDVNTNAVQQVTFGSTGATFWLSPDGATVYFANTVGPAGNPGLYAVNSDGTNQRLLRQYLFGTPIGYAADNSLIIMRVENGAFQVLDLGVTAQQDQVMLNNAAPGATALCKITSVGADPICGGNFALAPYGHALIVQGLYANGTYKVWSDDLTTLKQMVVPSLSGTYSPIQLIGWDKIPTP